MLARRFAVSNRADAAECRSNAERCRKRAGSAPRVHARKLLNLASEWDRLAAQFDMLTAVKGKFLISTLQAQGKAH